MSRKHVPTRRAILSSALAAAALPASAAYAAAGSPLLQPTELGLEMLRLMPAHAEAVWHNSCCTGGPDEAALLDWEDQTWEAIAERAERATNVVDQAIAHGIWLGVWDDEYHAAEALAVRMAAAVLVLAGIALDDCSVDACIKKHWGEREPWQRRAQPSFVWQHDHDQSPASARG